MLIHILLEPRTVEKLWDEVGGERLCIKVEKERYFSYHYCYHLASAVVSNMCGGWSMEQYRCIYCK